LLFIIVFCFRLDKATKELKETSPYVVRFNELNSKYGQTLIDNKNLKDTNKASIDWHLYDDNFEYLKLKK